MKIGALPPKVVKLIFLGDLLVRHISLTVSGESAPTNITASPQSYLKLKRLEARYAREPTKLPVIGSSRKAPINLSFDFLSPVSIISLW